MEFHGRQGTGRAHRRTEASFVGGGGGVAGRRHYQLLLPFVFFSCLDTGREEGSIYYDTRTLRV
jgi:hypothetical protein